MFSFCARNTLCSPLQLWHSMSQICFQTEYISFWNTWLQMYLHMTNSEQTWDLSSCFEVCITDDSRKVSHSVVHPVYSSIDGKLGDEPALPVYQNIRNVHPPKVHGGYRYYSTRPPLRDSKHHVSCCMKWSSRYFNAHFNDNRVVLANCFFKSFFFTVPPLKMATWSVWNLQQTGCREWLTGWSMSKFHFYYLSYHDLSDGAAKLLHQSTESISHRFIWKCSWNQARKYMTNFSPLLNLNLNFDPKANLLGQRRWNHLV